MFSLDTFFKTSFDENKVGNYYGQSTEFHMMIFFHNKEIPSVTWL